MKSETTKTYSPHLYHRAAAVILVVVFSLLLMGKFSALQFYYPRAGLDPSWALVLSEAHAKGWRLGPDIVFTGGPLSAIFTRSFQNENWFVVLVLSISIVVFIGLALARIVMRCGVPAAIAMAILIMVLLSFTDLPRDTLLIAVPFLLAVVVLLDVERRSLPFIIFGLACASAAALAKFSVFPVLVITCVLLDVVAVARRQWPLYSVIAAACFATLFVLAGQNPADLPAFLRASFESSAGYTAAMSVYGRSYEIVVWLLGAGLLLFVILVEARRNLKSRATGPVETPAFVLVFALYLFIVFKAGFVRHDLHSLIAWGGLVLAAATYGTLRWSSGERSAAALAFVLALAAAVSGHMLLHHTLRPNFLALPLQSLHRTADQIREAGWLISSPAAWLKRHQENKDKALAVIRASHPLPPLQGSVDIIPSDQSALIAARLDYRPRPVFQEYTTYSAPLIARNRHFFESDRAPAHLLMRPGSIDRRHPASAEGSLWPLFLARYEPASRIHDMIVLTKRDAPLENLAGTTIEARGRFREDIAVPSGYDPLFLKADIHMKPFGRALDILFKPPMVTMVVSYANGIQRSYRVIPDMIREGMIVSPLVETSRDYVLLAAGRMDAPSWRRPVAIRFESSMMEALAYEHTIAVSFTPIRAELLRASAPENELVASEGSRIDDLATLVSHNPLKPPTLDLVEEGLLAHAPMTLGLPVTPGGRFRLAFGLRDGAWQGQGATDGVCFAARVPGGPVLFERCLDPKAAATDRGLQETTVAIPDGVTMLLLETACRGNCAWDWSYWRVAAPAAS